MTAPTRTKMLRITTGHRPISLASIKPMPSDVEAGSAERARLYCSGRWRRARLRFLAGHPLCVLCEQAGCVVAAVAVDHRDGHRTVTWLHRFWDETRWQGLCLNCHNRKSATELAEWNRMGMDSGDTTGGGG